MDNCANFDIVIKQGATFIWPVYYQDEEGEVVVITDYEVLFQVRATPADEEVVVEASTDDGRIVVDGPAGLITITIPDEVTDLLESGFKGVYDLKITSPGGVADRIIQGGVYISPQVSRPEEA